MIDEITVLGKMTPAYGLELFDARRMGRILKKYQETEKPLEITISIHHRQRSLAQNRYMWGVIVPTVHGFLQDTQGEKYTRDEVYYYINSSVLGRKVVIKNVAGEEVPVLEGKKFSQMNTKEFSEAVDEIIHYFDQLGLEIKLPVPGTNNLLNDMIKDD